MSNCRTFRFYNRVGVVFQVIKQILWSIILMHTSRYWFFAKGNEFLDHYDALKLGGSIRDFNNSSICKLYCTTA